MIIFRRRSDGFKLRLHKDLRKSVPDVPFGGGVGPGGGDFQGVAKDPGEPPSPHLTHPSVPWDPSKENIWDRLS